MPKNELLVGHTNENIRYRTGIVAPDDFIYLKKGNIRMVFFDAREYEIMKSKTKKSGRKIIVKKIEPFLDIAEKMPVNTGTFQEKVLLAILKEHRIKDIAVSNEIAYHWGKLLEKNGFRLTLKDFDEKRITKSEEEIRKIKSIQKRLEKVYQKIENIFSNSVIKKNKVYYQNKLLTSGTMKRMIKTEFMNHRLSWEAGMIVSSGAQTVRPHDMGSGPIRAHQPIIIDLFPRDEKNGYFSDMTRTFALGSPSEKIKKMYETVKKVQQKTVKFIEVGMKTKQIYTFVLNEFEKLGYKTVIGEKGFVHGVGHGVGLQIHERPSIKKSSEETIKPGMVFSVEPGLYYPKIGGARIEDLIIIHPNGKKENITKFKKEFIVK